MGNLNPHFATDFAEQNPVHYALTPNLFNHNVIHAKYPSTSFANPMAVNAGPFMACIA